MTPTWLGGLPAAQARYGASAKGRATRLRAQSVYLKRMRARARTILHSAMVTAGCIDCGYNTNPLGMDFDHVRGIKKHGVREATSWAALWRELEKCDVRCGTCHNIRTRTT